SWPASWSRRRCGAHGAPSAREEASASTCGAPYGRTSATAPPSSRSRGGARASDPAGSSSCWTSRARCPLTHAPCSRSRTRLPMAAAGVAEGAARVEVFGGGPRLTHSPSALARRDPDEALRRAAESVVDWDGGTRIGDSVREYLRTWAWRGACRHAVVVLCSD